MIERARHHRWLNEPGDADAARQDLAEAQEIAAFSNMKLHLLDICLEQAVWALREGRNARALLDETAELLAQTQCTRRALELKALKEIVR